AADAVAADAAASDVDFRFMPASPGVPLASGRGPGATRRLETGGSRQGALLERPQLGERLPEAAEQGDVGAHRRRHRRLGRLQAALPVLDLALRGGAPL